MVHPAPRRLPGSRVVRQIVRNLCRCIEHPGLVRAADASGQRGAASTAHPTAYAFCARLAQHCDHSAGLRTALARAAAAEQAQTLLLEELRHRTKNDLAMVVSMLSMQARLKTNTETRAALEKAIGRIQAIASAHEYFQPREAGGGVEMAAYLGNLCGHLGDGLRDLRPIAVRVDAAEVYLPAEQAAPLGLIVNELVTNALKHAFPQDRAGTIDVSLKAEGALTLCVKDNGIGCPIDRREGLGSRLTRLLAQQLGAQIVSEPCDVGCEVRVVFERAKVDQQQQGRVTARHVQSA